MIGISEAFTFQIPEGYEDQDFLYYSGGLDDLWLGLWGILRVYGQRVPHLFPLPDRPEPPPRDEPLPVLTGNPPPRPAGPGDPCPSGAPRRVYEVAAIQVPVVYNRFGDHDPYGLIFAFEHQVPCILAGRINPEPLVLRANAGDCIEVRLTNRLPGPLPPHVHPEVPVDASWPPSTRVSLQPQKVIYDPLRSGGVTVGFNPDQTVGMGETITYRWYADKELGTCMLISWGDPRSHRHHGLFGALIVEPLGSTWQPVAGSGSIPGAMAIIKNRFTRDFREFVLFMQDGIALVDRDGKPVPDPVDPDDPGARVDFEDQGQKGFNYRSEQFRNRLTKGIPPSRVFSSTLGDPAPILVARAGEAVPQGLSHRRAGGPETGSRRDREQARAISPEILEKAGALRREVPTRSLRQIIAILELSGEVAPGTLKHSTLARHLDSLTRKQAQSKVQTHFRRFEAPCRNAVWQGDCQHTLYLPDPDHPGRKRQAYLIAFIDDYSRLITHAQFRTILKDGDPR